MKKAIRLLLILLSLFVVIETAFAFFNTTANLNNSILTKRYNISISANGGYFTNKKVVVSRNATTLPIPNRVGYTFLGYSKIKDGEVNYNYNIEDVNAINNTNIYAKWKINNYSISYNLNGGSLSNPINSYTVEQRVTLPIPTKKGYTFTGWSNSNTIEKGSIGNKTFTANWKINSYSISYNLNGGSLSNPINSYTVEQRVTLPIPTKKGYTFKGWSNSNVIEKGSTGNKTFTANWQVNSYSISYNLNGGSLSNPINSYTVEQRVTLPIPTKKGYTFTGWSNSNIIEKGSIGNKSFTANWQVNSYSISYNLNGGSLSNPINSYTVEQRITLPIPTKKGYTFTGWSNSNTIEKGSVGNKSFTANWNIKTFTVTYLVDGNVWQTKRINYGDVIPADRPATDNWHNFYGWNNYQNTMPEHDLILTGTIDFTKCAITTGHSQPSEEPWRTDKFIRELASVGITGWKVDFGNGGGKFVTTAQIYPIDQIEAGFATMWNSSGSTLRWVHIQCDNGYSYVKTR